MRVSVPLTITLSKEMAKRVKARVASGDYVSESEVIREGLRALEEREAALEQWLRTEGVARYEAYISGKTKTVPADEAFARVKAQIGKRSRKA